MLVIYLPLTGKVDGCWSHGEVSILKDLGVECQIPDSIKGFSIIFPIFWAIYLKSFFGF